jgi:hypothetical protein
MTGKPILIQNVGILGGVTDESGYLLLNFFGAVVEENVLWFSSRMLDEIFCLDLVSNELRFIDRFPHKSATADPYRAVTKVGDKLVFAPINGNDIVVYNTVTREFRLYDLIIPQAFSDMSVKFYNSVFHNGAVYIFGANYPGVLKFHLETGEQTLYTECFNHKSLSVSETGVFFAPDRYIDGNAAFFPCRRANAILEFRMDCGKLIVHELGDDKYICGSLSFDGTYFWIGPAECGDAIKRWNKETGEVKEHRNYPIMFDSGGDAFFSSCCANGYVWLFPYKANMILKLNTMNGEMETVKIFDGPPDVRGRCHYTHLMAETGKILVLTVDRNELLSIDTRMQTIETGRLRFPDDLNGSNPVDYYIKKEMDEAMAGISATPYDHIYHESEVLSVPAICDAVAKERPMRRADMKRAFDSLFADTKGESGRKIYDYCLKQSNIGVSG